MTVPFTDSTHIASVNVGLSCYAQRLMLEHCKGNELVEEVSGHQVNSTGMAIKVADELVDDSAEARVLLHVM
jgi:hypothetical protein